MNMAFLKILFTYHASAFTHPFTFPCTTGQLIFTYKDTNLKSLVLNWFKPPVPFQKVVKCLLIGKSPGKQTLFKLTETYTLKFLLQNAKYCTLGVVSISGSLE